jgi:hypothetical protein
MNTNYSNNCSFCQEIHGNTEFNFFEIYLKEKFLSCGLANRIVAESKNFILMPMVGPLVPGYLLIVSKKHYLSFAHIPNDILEEAKVIQQTTSNIFEEYYCKPVFFEHGPMSDVCKGGCCSVHAHIHCAAVEVDIYSELTMHDFDIVKLNNLTDITTQSTKNKPYLYYENQHNNKFLIEVEDIESQFIRKLIGRKIGYIDKLEWSQNIQFDWMIDIIKKLKPVFNNLKGTSIWQ